MVLDERKAIRSPEATGEPRFFHTERLPVRAVDDAAGDVTGAILAVDGKAAPPGTLDRRFIGLTAPHVLELEFGSPLDDGRGSPVLVADGWIEYPVRPDHCLRRGRPGAAYQAPTIEARDEHGAWRVVRREFGYPAGMARRMSVPLGRLPRGTSALRVRTNQEIYWDRLAVAYAESGPQATRAELPLRVARVSRTGYAVRELKPDRLTVLRL